jgi:hypothetical protein
MPDTTGIVVITPDQIAVLFNLPQQTLPDLNKGMAEGQLPVQAIGADGSTVVDSARWWSSSIRSTRPPAVQLAANSPVNVQLWPGVRQYTVLINTLCQSPWFRPRRSSGGRHTSTCRRDTAAVRPITVSNKTDLQAVIAGGLMAAERRHYRVRAVADGTGSGEERRGAGQVSTDPRSDPRAPAPPKGKGQRQQGASPGRRTARPSRDRSAQPGQRRGGAAALGPDQPAPRRSARSTTP